MTVKNKTYNKVGKIADFKIKIFKVLFLFCKPFPVDIEKVTYSKDENFFQNKMFFFFSECVTHTEGKKKQQPLIEFCDIKKKAFVESHNLFGWLAIIV